MYIVVNINWKSGFQDQNYIYDCEWYYCLQNGWHS